MKVPQPTIEKPLTAIDYIAVMNDCTDYRELVGYVKLVPPEIFEDERFVRAFKNRLNATAP